MHPLQIEQTDSEESQRKTRDSRWVEFPFYSSSKPNKFTANGFEIIQQIQIDKFKARTTEGTLTMILKQ